MGIVLVDEDVESTGIDNIYGFDVVFTRVLSF